MPTFKLDDREIPFEAGETIIQAAHRAGVDIPHYCWHPGLSIAANCRMCLVEVKPPPGRSPMMLAVLEWDAEKQEYVDQQKPKLQPSCQMRPAEGMEVLSESSEHVAHARSAVQELLLLNHPVDCPICDQAGECRLQDYWLEHQGTKKRMRDEPIHKPKAQVFGPTIVYDAERCIVCTRCVRFCDEVAKDAVLDIRERGNLNEVVVSPGRELDHPYTLMTEFVCPVGALTATDFRFKARVWFLRSVRSVCVGCATGCNSFTDYDPRSQQVQRYRPRENLDVNQYWMCDEGMLDYARIHRGRVLKPRLGGKSGSMKGALKRAAKLMKGVPADSIAIVLSAEHSNEDNFALLTLARDYLGTGHFFVTGRPAGEGDDILRHRDKNPNAAGVTAMCSSTPPLSIPVLMKSLEEGRITHVIALGSELPDPDRAEGLSKAKVLIALSSHDGPWAKAASVVLPASSWAECDGTFVNAKGLAQESERAVFPQGESQPGWKLVATLGVALGHKMDILKLADMRRAMAPDAGVALEGNATGVGATP